MRTIWVEPDGATVAVIDQTQLPHRFAVARLTSLEDVARAIETMQVRGAPLIGAAAAYGICLALRIDASDASLDRAYFRALTDLRRIQREDPAAPDSLLPTMPEHDFGLDDLPDLASFDQNLTPCHPAAPFDDPEVFVG